MFWNFVSIQMFVTGVRTVSTQNTAGDRVKESLQRTSSRKRQQQPQHADIEQKTNEMFVMHYRKVERYFENVCRHHREEGWLQAVLQAVREVPGLCNP